MFYKVIMETWLPSELHQLYVESTYTLGIGESDIMQTSRGFYTSYHL
jgi:hypothetical protein